MSEALVGRSVERFEDWRLLRGRGQYVDDVHYPGMLYAAIFRSPVAHGRIRAVDIRAARALPGVHAVFTARDIAENPATGVPCIPNRLHPVWCEQPVIAAAKVRYVGEPVAVVIAEAPAIAEDAAEMIALEVDALPAVTGGDRGRNPALLFEERGTNLAFEYHVRAGDAARVFDDPALPYRRRETFTIHRHTAVCMEPRGLLAIWNAAQAKLVVHGAAKVPYDTRRVLAQRIDLPEDCVEMMAGDVGGGFGVRGEFHPEDFLIPFAAKRLGRAVKWTEDRRENLLAANHAREVECEIEIACNAEGTILALRGDAWVDAGAYMKGPAAIGPRNVVQFMTGPYRIPNVTLDSHVLLSNKTPIGTYRGPGRYEADFFRERLFDMAARDLAIDPVTFRRRNLVRADEMPYRMAAIHPVERQEELDSGDYRRTLDRCLAEIDWQAKSAMQGKLIDGRYHGLGVGCFIEGGAAGPRELARLAIESDGLIGLYVGSTSVGQGLETTCLQIAADALDVPMERIRIFHGSTMHLREGFGSFHSRSTAMGGSAIHLAAKALVEEIRRAAAQRLGCAPEEIVVSRGLSTRRHSAPADAALPIAAFAGAGLTAEGNFANHRHTYAYGAAAAHVTVDARTGRIEVLEYVSVEDIGRVVNPLLAHGQAIGAIVQGLGGTLLEHLQYDADGQILTGSLADYLLPSSCDFPNIKAIVLGEYPAPHIPLGTKGGGEGGIVPVAGVIGNAVAAALTTLGVEPRDLPLTPNRIWSLLESRRNGERHGHQG